MINSHSIASSEDRPILVDEDGILCTIRAYYAPSSLETIRGGGCCHRVVSIIASLNTNASRNTTRIGWIYRERLTETIVTHGDRVTGAEEVTTTLGRGWCRNRDSLYLRIDVRLNENILPLRWWCGTHTIIAGFRVRSDGSGEEEDDEGQDEDRQDDPQDESPCLISRLLFATVSQGFSSGKLDGGCFLRGWRGGRRRRRRRRRSSGSINRGTRWCSRYHPL